MTWAQLGDPENGGATILSYHLQYDDSSAGATWTDLSGLLIDDLRLAWGVTNSIQKGHSYLFRYRAKNAHGWGPFSQTLSLIAARRTDKPDTALTSNEGTLVRITWAEPAYDGGSPILGYRIKIQCSDNLMAEQMLHCDGRD